MCPVVGVVTWFWLEIRGSLLGGARDFSLLKNVMTKTGDLLSSHSVGVRAYIFKGVKLLVHKADN
jgi:hypothetical protein